MVRFQNPRIPPKNSMDIILFSAIVNWQISKKMWNGDILNYEASDPKYEYFLAIFGVSGSNSSQRMISWGFIKIGSYLSDIWPFYGQKLPRKFSFSRYNSQFNYSDSLNRRSFVPNLVFFYSLGTTAMGHGQITNLKNYLLQQNRIFLSESFPSP